jgi:hypothetical protein
MKDEDSSLTASCCEADIDPGSVDHFRKKGRERQTLYKKLELSADIDAEGRFPRLVDRTSKVGAIRPFCRLLQQTSQGRGRDCRSVLHVNGKDHDTRDYDVNSIVDNLLATQETADCRTSDGTFSLAC